MRNFHFWISNIFHCILAKENKRGIGLMNAALGAAIAGVVISGLMYGGKELIDRMRERQIVSSMEKFGQAFAKFEDDFGAMPGDISDVTAFSGSYAGNADGKLSKEESKRIWSHLQGAGLISGKFDPSSNVPGKGFPAGPLPNSGFVITEYADETLLKMHGFSKNPDGEEILPYKAMQNLDKKFDDGNLNTGTVRGTGDACITGGSCSPAIVLGENKTPSVTASNNGCPLIPQRTIACTDPGTTGTITETCANGAWTVDQRNCTALVCVGQNAAGEPTKRSNPCPDGYSGSIQENCINGQWTISANSNGCVFDDLDSNDGENLPEGVVCAAGVEDFLACPYTKKGYVKRKCESDGLKWSIVENQCTDITCSGGEKLGKTKQVNCESGFTGNMQEICTVLGWQLASNNCVSNVQESKGCLSSELDQTRTKKCAPGFSGEITEMCSRTALNETSWILRSNNCAPATCDGSQVGSVRSSSTENCPGGNVGRVTDTCVLNSDKNSASWQSSTANCTALCRENYSNYISWPNTLAGQTSSMSCPENFTGGEIIRACQSDGIWDIPNGTCTPIKPSCSGTTEANATWKNGAVAGDVVTGICQTGYEGAPTRTCNNSGNNTMVGVWGNISGTCTPIKSECSGTTEANATWSNGAVAGDVVTGICQAGYYGAPTRTCNNSGNNTMVGVWGNISGSCISANCPLSVTSGSYGTPGTINVTWNAVTFFPTGSEYGDTQKTITIDCSTLNIVSAKAGFGYGGSLSRTCANGAWGAVSGICMERSGGKPGPIEPCPGITEANATWENGKAGYAVTGICQPGYYGEPIRKCGVDGWGNISGSCRLRELCYSLWSLGWKPCK